MQRVPFNSTIGYDNFHQDDIALLQVEYIRGSFRPTPICLPNGEITEPESTCYAIGWGLTNSGGYPADILQEVELPVADTGNCIDTYKELGVKREVYQGKSINSNLEGPPRSP